MKNTQLTEELMAITANERLFSEPFDSVFNELGRKLTACMGVERVNVWLFNESDNSIDCIGNFVATTGEFSKGERLFMHEIPVYFQHLKSNKVLKVDDVHTDPITEEIKDVYCRKHGITALLDVPIRLQGRLRGVLCYENVGETRQWTPEEVQFALAINQVVSLALETTKRRTIQKELLTVLKEKELLLKEMHHRIKNNLNVLISLLRIQGRESGNTDVRRILSDCEGRIFSMAKIHEQLYHSGNYLKVRLDQYLSDLIKEFKESSGRIGQSIAFDTDLTPVSIETARAVDLGLIVMEILNNALKHAFPADIDEPMVNIVLNRHKNELCLSIKDNGVGFDASETPSNSLGITLVKDLAEQMNARLEITSDKNGTSHLLYF